MTFYFYDLETSGINARSQRIMQFAGQRTDENFNPIGEPQNWLVTLTDEVLPLPEAVLVTGITPQKTLAEGYTEAEFLKLFHQEVLQPDTVILGFNTVHFDDEFMRATLWRNFYDPYEWHWQDERSRWDLLDVIRMIRALRPEGIRWPFIEKTPGEKVPTNRLELLTELNGLDHQNAHDALGDVHATIAIAKLLKEKQPKIFDYLFSIRSKKQVQDLINLEAPKPLLYSSGRYSNKWLMTAAVVPVAPAPHGGVLVYDLRQDPSDLASLTDDELSERLFIRNQETEILPIKNLRPNSCPAVAPLGVLDTDSQQRLELPLTLIEQNYKKLLSISGFGERISQLFENYQANKKKIYEAVTDPDLQIYDGFINDQDKIKLRIVRAADENSLADLDPEFSDERLEKLLSRYKARNFPRSLTASERETWEEYRTQRIMQGLKGQPSLEEFIKQLSELSRSKADDENAQYLLEELRLYAESVAPLAE